MLGLLWEFWEDKYSGVRGGRQTDPRRPEDPAAAVKADLAGQARSFLPYRTSVRKFAQNGPTGINERIPSRSRRRSRNAEAAD